MASIMYMLGLSGNMGGGLLDNFLFLNWVPLWQNHWPTYLMQIGVGLSFTVISSCSSDSSSEVRFQDPGSRG